MNVSDSFVRLRITFRPLALISALTVALVLLVACDSFLGSRNDPREGLVESWELLPLYGQIRLRTVDQSDGSPLANVLVTVTELPIDERSDEAARRSDSNGWIILHQTLRGVTYVGDRGPKPPQFTFEADGFQPITLGLAELEALPPPDLADLPQGTDEEADDLPVHQFEIRLSHSAKE